MARRFGSRQFTSRGPRRKTSWIASADQGFVTIATNTSVLHQSFSVSPAAPGGSEPTLVRTRGLISIHPSVFNADLEVVGAVGMGVISDQALAVGASAIPGAWTDAGSDIWFVWQPLALNFEFGSAVGTEVQGAVQFPFDSKAMRKLHDGESMVVMVESQAGAFDCAVSFRQLLKLP